MCADAPSPDEPLPEPVEPVEAVHLRVLGELYGLLTAGDFEAFLATLQYDTSVFVPGTSQIAGDYDGGDEVAGWLRRRIELTGGTLEFQPPESLVADSLHGFALVLESARRGDRFLVIDSVHVWRFPRPGTEESTLSWMTYPGEQYRWDRFWS